MNPLLILAPLFHTYFNKNYPHMYFRVSQLLSFLHVFTVLRGCLFYTLRPTCGEQNYKLWNCLLCPPGVSNVSNASYMPRPSVPSCYIPTVSSFLCFPIKILHALPFFHMRPTCPADLMFSDFTIVTTFRYE
jgi:hypothetical protein